MRHGHVYLSYYASAEFAEEDLREAGYDPADIVRLLPLIRPGTPPKLLIAALSTLYWMSDPPQEAMEPARALVTSEAKLKAPVRANALALVSRFLKHDGQELYLQAMADRRLTEEWSATRALVDYGDERALPALLKRFADVGTCGDDSLDHSPPEDKERILLVTWLHPYRDRPKVTAQFDRLIVNWDLITEAETDWMYEHLEYFHRPDLRPRSWPPEESA